MVTGAEKAAVPRPKCGPLTPPRPSVGPVLGTGGSALTWAWVLSLGGTDPGPKAQHHQGHPYRIPFLPSPGNGSFVTSGQGHGSEDKVHAGAFDLTSPIPVGTRPSGSHRGGPGPQGPAQQGSCPRPLHPSSVFTQLPDQGLPTCSGHTRMHRHTQVPHPNLHAYLPTYLRRRPEGRGPARVSRFSPHPAAVESHGPPPAPLTKPHNNRHSKFR